MQCKDSMMLRLLSKLLSRAVERLSFGGELLCHHAATAMARLASSFFSPSIASAS
jgi:hypothetical protein